MSGRSSKFILSEMAAQIGNAAKAGFGLSLGRDIHRGVRPKNASPVVVILVAICGAIPPALGGVILTQGYRRGWIGTIFLTIGLSILAVIVGFFLIFFLAMLFADILFRIRTDDFIETYGGWVVAATAGLALFGMMVGLFRRPRRLKRFAAIEHNEAFLAENGFKETPGKDVTHYDPEGNPLRFLEGDPERLIFMAVGRRGRRAYIDLDNSGRMVSYSGIV